jgi:hypothetical protein
MPDGHRPGTSQVTTVDDQFGIHTLRNVPPAASDNETNLSSDLSAS